MQALKAGVLYFLVVFAAGFALGSVRVLWAVPYFGARTSELAETPVILAVAVISAKWVLN